MLVYSKNTRENLVANSCKYLFPSGLSWNTQQQFGRCVKTQMNRVAAHLRLVLELPWPINVLLRMPLWRACLSYSYQSLWLLGRIRAPTQPKKAPWAEVTVAQAQRRATSRLPAASCSEMRACITHGCAGPPQQVLVLEHNWKHQNNNKIAVRENADLQVNELTCVIPLAGGLQLLRSRHRVKIIVTTVVPRLPGR